MIKRVLQSLGVSLALVWLVMLLLYVTTPSWWRALSEFLVEGKDLLETLYYIVTIVVPIWGGIWWVFFRSEEGKEEGVEPSPDAYPLRDLPGGKPKLPEDKFKLVRDHYLEWVSGHHNRARLHGLEDLKKSSKTQTLDTIYTSLQVGNRFNRMDMNELLTGRTERTKRSERTERTKRTKPRHIAIIGGAGTGKTTYLDIVAYTLARVLRGEEVPGKLRLPDPVPVPFVAPLRFWNVYREMSAQQPDKSLDDPEHGTLIGFLFWYLRTNYHDFEAARDFFDHLLEHGDVLLMFDGLDEVVQASERQVVRDQIDRLLKHPLYKRHRCLVTAREAGYKDAPFGHEFLRCDIQPMSEAQIERLVARWCECLVDMEPKAQQDILRVIKQMNEEREQRGQPPLIATPLMVTMIVSVRYSQRELPKERAKLYDVVVKIILQKQYGADADVHGAREALITWGGPPDKQREWLSDLAFHMQQRGAGGALADESTVRDILTTALAERGETEKVKPFVQAMRKRGGLFEERGEQFQFMHLTFQEFLAAEYLSNHWPAHQEQLAKWVTDSWWRETLLLTIGKLDSPTPIALRKAFIDALLNVRTSAEVEVAAAEIVALGLLDLREPDKILQERAQEHLVNILTDSTLLKHSPPRRAKAGIILAQIIGDPRPDVVTVDGMKFCYVPKGAFYMGRDKVEIPYDYCIGRDPVTNAQFDEFVEGGGYGEARFWTEAEARGVWKDGQITAKYESRSRVRPYNFGSPYNLPNHPVVGITWYEALAFTRWLEERWGCKVRLPKEAEWEKAARGGDRIPVTPLICLASELNDPAFFLPSLPMQANPLPQRDYPWGNDPDPDRANFEESRIGHPNAIGCFPRAQSPYGCQEMSGNVWEWTESLYATYEESPKEVYERLDVDGPRVIRGGSYYVKKTVVLCFSRDWNDPNKRHLNFGFRVLRTPHI